MKSVLIVTPFFAPQSHAAVFRAHKLAKYLPKHGWKPYVLTVDTNYLYDEDPGLLADLPNEVDIIRARYIEPTVRGLREMADGRDRVFRGEQKQVDDQVIAQTVGASRSVKSQFMAQWYSRLLRTFVHSPDSYWTWFWPAVKAGRELIDQHGIDVVYTTCPPYTAHRVGHALQELGVKWVADFRDPVAYASKNTSSVGHIRAKQRGIVADTLRHANAVTLAAQSFELIYNDMFGSTVAAPMQFIPTGIDTELHGRAGLGASDGPRLDEPYLIHVGDVMPDYGAEFFRYLRNATARRGSSPRILMVGNAAANRRRLASILGEGQLSESTVFMDRITQSDLYPLIQRAEAAILTPGRTRYWWTLHAKLVDYVGLRKPVLAVVPDPSEARSILAKTNLGVFLDGDEMQASETLARFLTGELRLPEPNVEECNRFIVRRQVSDFAALFQSLT